MRRTVTVVNLIRDTATETTRGLSVDQVREIYFDTDWPVHEGPSQFYPPYSAR